MKTKKTLIETEGRGHDWLFVVFFYSQTCLADCS